jgi:predicted transcriptional regulator
MSGADANLKGASESVRISREVKKRLQDYSRQHNQPLRRILDQAIFIYVQKRRSKE